MPVSATPEASTRTDTTIHRTQYMTCLFFGGVLGVSTYDDDCEEIKAFQGWEADKGPTSFQILKLVLLHVMPQIVFVSSSAPQSLITAFNDWMPLGGMTPPEIRLEKNVIFHVETAFALLKMLTVVSMPSTIRDADRMHWMHARLNLAATQQIRAIGALLHILQMVPITQLISVLHEISFKEGKELVVQDISGMKLEGYLTLDRETLSGLQIFQEDAHPSILGIGRSKEGFSVFGMMDRCLTLAGRRLLHSWFLRPLLNLDMINDRLNTIELLVNRSDILAGLRSPLKQIKDIPAILKALQCHQAQNKVQLLRSLKSSIGAILDLARLVRELGNGSVYQYSEDSEDWCSSWSNLLIVQKFETHITSELKQCGRMIDKVIDFDVEDETMYIASHICSELDKLKDLYAQLPDVLTQVVEKELRSIPRCLSRGMPRHHVWSIVYVPQVGYLVQVLGSRLGAEILDILDDYEQAFESTADNGSLIFYYTAQCTDALNDRFGDILHKIQDMENGLCAELISCIMDYKSVLIKSTCVCAELDCLMSLALCAHDGNYCRPVVTHSDVLVIEQGRHPLTEIIVDAFIPNDTQLSSKDGCIQLITGPNASGKSCYMKQVAVIVFLSHIGSFVPAKVCHVGLTDRIFSRICTPCDTKTSRVNQSTFMRDMTQISTMIQQATNRSLLLIDEFGKGTLTSDGVGLFCSLLEHWSAQEKSPKIIACTHFSELFTTGLTEKCPRIQYRTMQVVTEPRISGEDDLDEQHILLYKLIPGHAASSYGIHCAQACRIPADVISRAKDIVKSRESGDPLSKLPSEALTVKDRICEEWIDRLMKTDSTSMRSIEELLDGVKGMARGF